MRAFKMLGRYPMYLSNYSVSTLDLLKGKLGIKKHYDGNLVIVSAVTTSNSFLVVYCYTLINF